MSQPKKVTPQMIKSVSPYRRELLEREVEAGVFSDGRSREEIEQNKLTKNSYVVSAMSKKGQMASGGGGYRGTNASDKQAPDIYSPLWLTSNLSLPRDRATINAWCRSYFALNGLVQNSINLHSTYPISKLNIKCKNKEIENFFSEMAEEIDLMNSCVQIAQEFWLLGEAFPYLELDENQGKWTRIVIQNPDYIDVKNSNIDKDPILMLIPDANLKRIVTSGKSADIEQRKQLDPYIVECVKKGQNIPLDPLNISMIARKIAPYENRGTGLPVSIFRQLMLFDKIRESHFAQADDMINPLTIFKIGSESFKPTPADLEAYKNIVEQATYDKNYKLFTHEALDVQVIGKGSGILDTSGHITQLIKEIYTGLMVPSVIMDGGSDTTYSNGGVALDVLKQRYMQFRNMLAAWLKRKVFTPIAIMQDFYEYKDGKKTLIIPDVDWNHMALFDTNEHIGNLIQLSAGQEGEKRVSTHELHRALGLDFDDQMQKIKKENIANMILMKEKQELEKMTLNELRSLSDDDEIQQKQETMEEKEKLPGEEDKGAGGLPGMPDMPDLGGGGMPDMPDLGSTPPAGGEPPK